MVGTGVGAKKGILFKTAASLEICGKTNIVVLDKTGTVTEGNPTVVGIYPDGETTEGELLAFAAAVEKNSEHPLSRAIRREASRLGIVARDVSDFCVLPGRGLSARLGESMIYGGNLEFAGSKSEIPEGATAKAEALAEEGKTPLFFVKDNVYLGIIAVSDVVKPDSKAAIAELKKMGIRVIMLTGDNERTASAIGKEVGVDEVVAGVLPDGKDEVVRKLRGEGVVAMVGDGINDAPALTSADVGIAIGAGTDIAIDAADVVLMHSKLSDVASAIKLGRLTLRNIKQNLFWAFVYNVIGIPLAAGAFYPLWGWKLNPMFGAAAMSLSSFTVVSNALRLKFAKIDTKYIAEKENDKVEEQKMTKVMKIEGMMCPHCEARVKKCLEALDGVAEAVVDHKSGTATLTLSADVSDSVLKAAVEDQGYPVHEIK